MRFAYADPPYLGTAKKFYGQLHAAAADYDDPQEHKRLIERMTDEFADGWALSMTSGNLIDLAGFFPKGSRIGSWVKPFASFKPGVGVAYAWEPVVFYGGRPRTRTQPTVRDWCAVNITLRRGFTGAKPSAFVAWVLDVLNAEPADEVEDLFPGSGAVTQAINEWRDARNGECQIGMFASAKPSNEAMGEGA